MAEEEKYLRGRGAQSFINNSFEKNKIELNDWWMDEAAELNVKTKFIPTHAKTLVNEVPSDDIGVPYSANPYQGCEHGCAYCYARPTHEYWGYNAGLDFEQQILFKPNAAELLKKHFEKRNYQAQPILLSGNTDCYQPAENKLKITRSLLEVFHAYKHPLGIVTKNALLLRDIDILQDLAKENLIYVYISITGTDEELRLKMEPRTSTYINRFKVLEQLNKNKIPAGVLMAPIIPSLNSDAIPSVLKQAAENGAKTATYTLLRLNGPVAPIFRDWLNKNFPERAQKVWHQVESLHGGTVEDFKIGRRMRGEGPMAEAIRSLFHVNRNKYFNTEYKFEHNLKAFKIPGKGNQLNIFEGENE